MQSFELCNGLVRSSWNGVTSIHFYDPRVKTMAEVFVETVVEPIVQIFTDILFEEEDWIF